MHETREWLLGGLVLIPILCGGIMAARVPKGIRNLLIVLGGMTTIACSILLALGGTQRIALHPSLGIAGAVLEPLVGALVCWIGLRIRSRLICAMAAMPLLLTLASLLTGNWAHTAETVVVIDSLSLVMVLIISIVGGLITFFAIGYMDQHEQHSTPTAMDGGSFLGVLVAFLGLMNGLVLTDDLRWLTIFWEATTLCSFLLIGYEGSLESNNSARRALLINTFGGTCLAVASFVAERDGHGTLSSLLTSSALLPLALMAVASMSKAAQLPFQSWLLGAMVAPTPVSALLHSSTMVKAGSYLVLRLAPALDATVLGGIISLAGAFTFAAASAMSISQSNGKRVLAYSTIANLGLIAACAGIHSPLAFAAALTILIFHAVSKALLFLCVGTIEQTIGSRHIEDMGGILFKMPLTTTVTGRQTSQGQAPA